MMFKLGRIILVSLVTLTTTLLLTVLAVTVYWHTQGGAILAVQTGSMVPTFSRGDALVVRRIAPADLAIGDIVSYESALRPGTTVSHRIVYIDRKARTVTTRGDHLAQPDTPIAINAVRGRAFVLLPKFGYVVTALHTPFGLVAMVYVPAASITGYELRRLQYRRRKHYVLAGFSQRLAG
jgi:signal peptidase